MIPMLHEAMSLSWLWDHILHDFANIGTPSAMAASPANHRVLLEDDEVRVLEVTVQPGERENLHHHRWPSIMVVLARPDYRNFDAEGNEIPPSGGTPSSPALPRAVRLPPQKMHAIEVAADASHPFRGIRFEFKTPKT